MMGYFCALLILTAQNYTSLRCALLFSFYFFNPIATVARSICSDSIPQSGVGHSQPYLALIQLRLVEMQFTFQTPLRNDHAGRHHLRLHDADGSDVHVCLAVVLPKLFRCATVGREFQHGIVEHEHRLLELLAQLPITPPLHAIKYCTGLFPPVTYVDAKKKDIIAIANAKRQL